MHPPDSRKTVLILTGTPHQPRLEETPSRMILHADGPLEAAHALTLARPDIVVVEAGIEWHASFVDRIPRETRPAVVAMGEGAVSGTVVDEWIRRSADTDEIQSRLALAWERACERRHRSRQVFTDVLTGLPNRRAVIRALTLELGRRRRSQTPLALVLLDLDDFKEVNDRSGHAAGDRLLHKVGNALRRATRSSELCGRIGGDEFALVLPGDLDAAEQAAKRLSYALLPLDVSATTAVGILKWGEQLRRLYRRTDDSLRDAKRRRKAELVIPPPTRIAVTLQTRDVFRSAG